jgi:hypothetical protein
MLSTDMFGTADVRYSVVGKSIKCRDPCLSDVMKINNLEEND